MTEDYQQFDDLNSFEESELEPKSSRKRQLIVAIICVLIVVRLAVSLALIIKTSVISTYTVDGVSMYPTLDGGAGASLDSDRNNGETLYLNRLAKVKRGDIVVFIPKWSGMGDKALVKRVIAVAGDHLQIVDGKVWLNGAVLDEPYINEAMNHNYDGLVDVVTRTSHNARWLCIRHSRRSRYGKVISKWKSSPMMGQKALCRNA